MVYFNRASYHFYHSPASWRPGDKYHTILHEAPSCRDLASHAPCSTKGNCIGIVLGKMLWTLVPWEAGLVIQQQHNLDRQSTETVWQVSTLSSLRTSLASQWKLELGLAPASFLGHNCLCNTVCLLHPRGVWMNRSARKLYYACSFIQVQQQSLFTEDSVPW